MVYWGGFAKFRLILFYCYPPDSAYNEAMRKIALFTMIFLGILSTGFGWDKSFPQIRGSMSLKVRAYPEQAVTSLDGGQTIYIIVQDQRLLPVQDAQVSLVIRMPSGEEDRIILPTPTDKNGVTQFAFSFTTKTIGIVIINVTAVHERLQATTSTCFWLWW